MDRDTGLHATAGGIRSAAARCLAFILALPLCACLHAQQYGFTQFTPRDGLAQSQVRCMAQDRAGYLWLGTLGGVSRFDGTDFTNFGLREGLPDPQVNALLAASDGSVWLGCGSFLVRFDGHAMHNVPLPAGAAGSRILALAEGRDGTVFVGTDGAGLLQVRNGKVSLPEGWPADTATSVRTLLMRPNGELLAGTRNGLLRWWPGHCERVALPVPASISALAQGRNGTLWVGTFGNGLFGLTSQGGLLRYDQGNGLLQNNVRALLVDQRGRLWAGTKFGVNMLEDGRLRTYTVHQGMPNDNVWCITEDRDGGLWLGTDGAGVLRYAGERFVTYTVTDGLCSDLVMAAVTDNADDIWLGTYGNGVCRMDGMASINTLDGLPNNTVWSGLADPDGSLWFGTSDGLCRITNGVVVRPDSAHALSGQRILALYRTANGDLWCGMRDGVAILHPSGEVERKSEVGGITLHSVRGIREAGPDSLWLATDLGAVVLHKNAARLFTTRDGMSHNNVFCLERDGKGRIWFGTTNGLTCFHQGRFTAIDLGKSFGSNYVDLLLMGPNNLLWAGTNDGLFVFNPDSILANPSEVEHLTEEDGLRGMEFNLNAGFRDRKGRLFFGTNAGLVMHDPARSPLHGASHPPVTCITSVRSFMRPVPGVGGADPEGTGRAPLDVAYRKNHLTFTYTAIALSHGRHVRFQYRLAGFDDDWLPATEVRSASYSNLPQGNYRFEVRAEGIKGTWGPAAGLDFTITPPFWLRWWFFALCALAASGILYGILLFRRERRHRAERTRNLVLRSRMLKLEQQALNANMNRHFIFNALNSIQYSINSQDRESANKYLASFAKLIRKNLDASQSDTTSLAEELARLELYLLLEHRRFKDHFTYTIAVSPQVDPAAVKIPAMMLQPYVENSIWHGILPLNRAGHVAIEVERAGAERVLIRIIDDGIGIGQSREGKSTGDMDHISRGIEITKGRAEIMRKLGLSDIRITGPAPVPGKPGQSGTVVTIELPAAPAGAKAHLHSAQ